MAHATDIVAYIFRANTYCPDCIVAHSCGEDFCGNEQDEEEEMANALREAEETLGELESEEHGKCDSCEAAMINGVRCHEHGCPRSAQLKRARDLVKRLQDN